MRHLLKTFILVASAATLFSCDINAKYETEVEIGIDIIQMGSGYAEVQFEPSGDAWFCAVMSPAVEGYDPMKTKRQFMTYVLDAMYKKYINWRYDLLISGVPQIADFASHELQYGTTDKFFSFLEPDTDYWLFAFAVDPEYNKPAGKLFLQTVHTLSASEAGNVYEYRVLDKWDYVYPMDGQHNISSKIPWIGYTRDSLEVRSTGATSAKEYFDGRYESDRAASSANIFYGMYAHLNDGVGDGTSDTNFEEGHTYYTSIYTFDGAISTNQIYKFRWTQGMKASFKPEDALKEEW